MSYEYKQTDALEFFRTVIKDFRRHGNELEAKYCPYCHGGGHDEYTFSLNIDKGAFNCLRSSCGQQGHFVELCRDFDFELDWGKPKIYRELEQPKTVIKPNQSAIEYLKTRGIGEKVAEEYQISCSIQNPTILVMPFFDDQGKLQCIKYRNTKFKKGMKGNKEWFEKDTMPILFGMKQCKSYDRLIITEGQLDSLSVRQAGIDNAVSVPTGCQGFRWMTFCLDWMNKFAEIIVFGDWENGKMTLLDTIKARVKPTVKAVRRQDYLGEKDANDILCKFGAKAIQKAIENAEVPRIENVKELSAVQSVDINNLERIWTQIDELDRCIGGLIMGQVVLLTGKRGDGKSTFMSQLICAALDQGENVFVYSGELADFHFKRWIDYQLAGKDNLTETEGYGGEPAYTISDEVEQKINRWYQHRAYIYDNNYLPDDKGEYESLTETVEKVITAFGTRLICIDNLMTAMDTVTQQNNLFLAQSNFVGKLKKIALKYQVCIILVAHPRKSGIGEVGFDNDAVSGSSDITNKVDVVLNYGRNKDEDRDWADSILQVAKNRLFGKLRLGRDGIELNYSLATKRVTTARSKLIKHYGWETGISDEPIEFFTEDPIEDDDEGLPF